MTNEERMQQYLPLLRTCAGWTAKDLADQLEVSRQSISAWENYDYKNKKGVKLSKIQYLAIKKLLEDEIDKDTADENSEKKHILGTLLEVLIDHPDNYTTDDRKAVLEKGLEEETPLGRFLKANSEKFEEMVNKYKEMLEEVYKNYRQLADEVNWKKYNQNDLFFEYIKHENDSLKDKFYAGIVCRYWGLSGRIYQQCNRHVPFEQCYDILIDAINYVLEKRVWENPESSLYEDPTGPDKAFHIALRRQRGILLSGYTA